MRKRYLLVPAGLVVLVGVGVGYQPSESSLGRNRSRAPSAKF